ncbi:hypothetical protein [Streptomyces platensis]|uniref:hypothetical protein n=1 Tax=Streptomyces platensis TaxID=58346 RepID=UPI0037A56D6A
MGVTVVCAIASGLLLVGTVAYVTGLFRHGLRGCGRTPGWLNSYWSAMAVLAPLAAALLSQGQASRYRPRGTDLACAVVAADLAARASNGQGLKRVVRMIFR